MPSPRKGRSPARGASKSPARSSRRLASKSPARGKSEQAAAPSKAPSGSKSPSRSSKRTSPARTPKKSTKIAERPATPNRNRSPRSSPSPTRISGRISASSSRLRAVRTIESTSATEEKASKMLESEMVRGKKDKEQLLQEARSRLGIQTRTGVSQRITTTSTQQVSSSSSSSTGVTSRRVSPAAPSKEFGGTLGTFFMLFLLPATVYYITFACAEVQVPVKKGNSTKMKKEFRCSVRELPQLPEIRSLFSVEATLIFLGWFAFQALLAALPVGPLVEGQRLATGKKLKYRCNGLLALLVSLALFGAAVYKGCPVEKVYDLFPQLVTAATVFSFLLSIVLYVRACLVHESKRAPGGSTGSVIYDFFMGHELNPRIGSFDLKFFCELRPGLIGWVMLNLIFVLKAYKDSGSLHPGLTLVSLFQIVYVTDSLVFEEAILTTMDIIHDGFGFMLVFGDLVWVPFLYCLQTRFLLMNPVQLPWFALAGIAVVNILGYIIFRGANSQKNEFRKNPYQPRFADMETVKTSTGRSLLAGGWWGICRKPNYLGDLLMATAWCLPCGFHHILPYFYPIYFLVLLLHRERRDAHQCEKKYGASWKTYCQRVRYRIFPGIY